MRKITIKIVIAIFSMASLGTYGQGTGESSNLEFPQGIQNNFGVQNRAANAANDVLIAASPGDPVWITDVEEKIESIGEHDVETFLTNTGTPTLAELQSYDAVFVFTDAGVSDAAGFGNVLAQYIEGGGVVVDATFTPNVTIGGNWINYQLYSNSGQSVGANLMLGTINDPNHPILALDVNSIDGGTSSFHNTGGTVATGATIVAEWADASPFLIVEENVGPANVRRAFVNLYPPSEDARADFWDLSSDMAQLMSNALEWAITGDVLSVNAPDGNAMVSLFPNPANNQISLSNPNNATFKSAKIIDIVGREVRMLNETEISNDIDISTLKTGVYFLQLEGDTINQSIKFIKN